MIEIVEWGGLPNHEKSVIKGKKKGVSTFEVNEGT